MAQVTISKRKYEALRRQAAAYQKVAAEFFDALLKDPVEEVIADFRKSDLYTEEFLRDLDVGLRKSSYMKRYGNQKAKAGSPRISQRAKTREKMAKS